MNKYTICKNQEKNMFFEIIKKNEVVRNDCKSIYIKQTSGDFEILENHMNMIVALENAVITIDNKEKFDINIGICEIKNNKLSIVC